MRSGDVTETTVTTLIEIAASDREQGGSPFVIEGAQERAVAEKLLMARRSALGFFDRCEKRRLDAALALLRTSSQPLFPRPTAESRCALSPPMLTPLPEGHLVALTVFSGGGGLYGHAETISLTPAEWDHLISELRFNPERRPMAIEAEIRNIRIAVQRFEKIAGDRAGTDKDIGGFAGNDRMQETPSYTGTGGPMGDFHFFDPRQDRVLAERRRGQQDCIDEYRTLRQLVALLESRHLLTNFTIDRDEPMAVNTSPRRHVALRLRDRQGRAWVLDSWPRDNGELSDFLEEESWRSKWSSGK